MLLQELMLQEEQLFIDGEALSLSGVLWINAGKDRLKSFPQVLRRVLQNAFCAAGLLDYNSDSIEAFLRM